MNLQQRLNGVPAAEPAGAGEAFEPPHVDPYAELKQRVHAACIDKLGTALHGTSRTPAEREQLVADLAAVDGLIVVSSRLPARAAAGLHLASGQKRPAEGWFGRSCHDVADVRRAAAEGAAYVTLSPYAATASKPGYGPPVPVGDYAEDQGVPVLALGGVEPGNAAAARAAGAHGVAVMGCVMRAAEPASVVRALLREVEA
jgi:thiamine-phosphate pyrophosphorylase